MKKQLLFFFLFCCSWGAALAQTFTTSPGLFVPNNSTVTSNLTVSGVGDINCSYGLTQVCIDLTHNRDADLDIFLMDPNGDFYELTTDNGGSGDDYISTCFDMTAVTDITAGSAPFTGTFVPEGDIGLVNNGQDANGTWVLWVADDRGGPTGLLNSWSLQFDDFPPCIVPVSEDCRGGTTVCSDATFTGNGSGSGDVVDLTSSNDGCLSGENESSWYYFQAAHGGTFAFEIVTSVDYDFAVWGPMSSITCPPVGAPTRCSYSGTAGNTGLRAGSGDNTEGSGGDAFVDPIVAATDDIFILVIDNFTADGSSFDVIWTLSDGALLDCTPLPVTLLSFTGENNGTINTLEWKTASETNCSHYVIERSEDGLYWHELDQIAGAGNSSSELTYTYRDFIFDQHVNYYRLLQYDFDGTEVDLGTVTIDNRSGKTIAKIVDMMGREVGPQHPGLKLFVYTDGTVSKVVSK